MNPVGRGHAGPELPTVEAMDQPVSRTGKSGIAPATFLPISPHWPQRAGRRGKKYDSKWKRSRAPFYAEDFDWAYFQSAPADQQLDGYLRGDEELQFVNLSQGNSDWGVTLPGLRIRAFVKTTDGVVREPVMHLDTLEADLEEGKLRLTWRGHAPIQQIDMSDVQVVLIAQEQLAEAELPFQDYEAKLQEFAQDPVGLADAMPPGFLEVANAIQLAELAERNGEPPPDLRALAENLPAGCPFPPWFLAAAAGDPDPLGIEKKFPPGMLDSDDPLGLRDKIGDLSVDEKREPVLEELVAAEGQPELLLPALRKLAALLPPAQQPDMLASIAAMEQGLASAKSLAPTVGAVAAGDGEVAAKPAAEAIGDLIQQSKDELARSVAAVSGLPGPETPALLARLQAVSAQLDQVPTIDDVVAKALAPLDAMQLPDLPEIADVEALLAEERAQLRAQEAKMRQTDGEDPMLALFTFGHRLIDNAPRPERMVPDFGPIVNGLQQAHAALLGAGIGIGALAPLERMQQRVQAIQQALPARPPAPTGEFAGKSFRQRNFTGQDLRGAVFAGSDLTGALFAGANLEEADLRGADATKADFTGANLGRARLDGCTLSKAKLLGVQAADASFDNAALEQADLSGANLRNANLQQVRAEKAVFRKACLVGANLEFADLGKADLCDADLTNARLTMAVFQLAKADRICLRDTKADMTRFTLCRMQHADLRGMQSSMGSFHSADLRSADLRGCRFAKVDWMLAVLDGADFSDGDLRQSMFRDTSAIGARFLRARLEGASATGVADFTRADLRAADAVRSVWMDVELSGADLRGGCFEHASFQGVRGADTDFAGARLKGSCFRQAELRRPRFAQADLCGVDMTCARLDDANFRDANCYDMKLLGAKAARSDFSGAFIAGLQVDGDAEESA